MIKAFVGDEELKSFVGDEVKNSVGDEQRSCKQSVPTTRAVKPKRGTQGESYCSVPATSASPAYP